jgi:nucleotide-binding universal stress UspA family protein
MKRILVPTDGSRLSERAIPAATQLAQAQKATVAIARVVQYPVVQEAGADGYWDARLYDEIIEALDADARRGLDATAAKFGNAGVDAETAVFHGSPAGALLDYEELIRPDLVVMATHGRTGLMRFARGSVADAIVREGTAPVLLVRAFGPEATDLQDALVPLDGSPLAEEALPVVEALAQKPLKSVRLLRVVEAPADQPMAEQYLEGIATKLRTAGITVVADTRVGEPVEVIHGAAVMADLVVMATHGRGGFDRLRYGSVAEHSLRDLTVPVLLVRAGRPAPVPGLDPSVTTVFV